MTLRRLWATLNEPSDFRGQPYIGLLNQLGHSAIAAYVFLQVCLIWSFFAGEMPPRWAVTWGIVVLYVAAIENYRQGWRGWDSMIDAGFVAIAPLTISVATEEFAVDGMVSVIHVHRGILWSALTAMGAAWLVYAVTRFKGQPI